MKSFPQFIQLFSNYYVVLFMVVLLFILIRKVLIIFFGKSNGQDFISFEEMGEEEKKLYMITQINTKINKFFIDQSEHYANNFYQEIYGSPHKFAPPLVRKKEKRKDVHVTFTEKPIVLNPSS